MGNKDSKVDNRVAFEKAANLGNSSAFQFPCNDNSVSSDELNRLKAAFNQRTDDELLTSSRFKEEVLSIQTPSSIADNLFDLFSSSNNSNGLTFDELVIGLVTLTRANVEERRKWLHHLPSLEIWIEYPPMLTNYSRPKSSNFYQVLAGVTHLHENDVSELEKMWTMISDSRLCKLTLDRFMDLIHPPLDSHLVSGFFQAFDDNSDGLIDFKELICGLSASCRGPISERLKFIARIWDDDRDGFLSNDNIARIYSDLSGCFDENDIQIVIPSTGLVNLADFVCWAMETGAVSNLLACIEQIGHVCLGLTPESLEHQNRLVRNYKERLRIDDSPTWYVLSADWWRLWMTNSEDDPVQRKEAIPIDNSSLMTRTKADWQKLPSLTREGGHLRPDLVSVLDYELVSLSLWTALGRWHGICADCRALPRQVVTDAHGRRPGVELYPPSVVILRHAPVAGFPANWTKDLVATADVSSSLRRIPIATVTFSRTTPLSQVLATLCEHFHLDSDTARLWLVGDRDRNRCSDMVLLAEDEFTLDECDIRTGSQLLLEVRNSDLTWPEEVNQLKTSNDNVHFELGGVGGSWSENGITGLNNLGNSCYMNTALQCVSNTRPLTDYFIMERHVNDLKKMNQRGSRGSIAIEYANLVRNLWSGNERVVAPLKLRESISGHTQTFTARTQHDCQEFLAFLLDGLHEDLNRVHTKPYMNLKDSDGRPDKEVAQEAWNMHIARNQSIIVDLFMGMLKSCLTCKQCGNCSVRFDPFTFLQLPIPLEDNLLLSIVVVRRNGSVPVRFGLRLPSKASDIALHRLVAKMSGLTIGNFVILCLRNDGLLLNVTIDQMDSIPVGALLYAFETPSPLVNGGLLVDEQCQMTTLEHLLRPTTLPPRNAVLADQRDVYFLSHQRSRPVRFGLPLVVEFVEGESSGLGVYEQVADLVQRLVDVPVFGTGTGVNRALDADEGHQSPFPFTLKTVDSLFLHCSRCSWWEFCSGCPLLPTDQLLTESTNIAVDWEPAAFHLRYQHSRELTYIDDPSVSFAYEAHYKPISILSCLRDFTTAEQLEDGEMVRCKHCKENTPTSKKLDIWTLPRILIIHLKRFVFVENERRWTKSCKVVDFPLHSLDPSELVVGSCSEIKQHYDCFAIANHYGVMGGGHYIAHAKNANNQRWYSYNDSRCKQLSDESHIDKNNAYLLFYERVDPDEKTQL